jgi:hypothetical protein
MQPQKATGVRWEWISEAWQLFTQQWQTWVLMILIMCLVIFAIYLPFFGIMFSMAPSIPQGDEIPTAPTFPVALFAIYPILYLVVFAAVSYLFGGLYRTAFKQLRGEPISVGDLFTGGQYFPRILGAVVLIAIAAGIGGIFCLIPGLIVYGLTFLTFPMIVEGGKGTIDAIKASIEVTKRDWIMFTLFVLALYIVAMSGTIACGVGALATMPLLFLGNALAYRDLVGAYGAQRSESFLPPAPPDYRNYSPSPMSTPQASFESSYRPTPPQPEQPYRPAPPTPKLEPPYRPEPAPRPEPTYRPAPPPPPQTESSTRTCPHCGATLNRVANFCNQCGNRLGSA